MCTIVDSHYSGMLTNSDGSNTRLGSLLAFLNFLFTMFFAAELGIFAYSHWFLPFIKDPWSWLDMFVVSMCIASLIISDEHTGFVRIMRAFRVLRLFGHIPALRKILSALALAIVPVLNAFMILLILACICQPLQPD